MNVPHSDQMFELMSQGIWQVDAEGRTTYVNTRMAAMAGYSREEFLPLSPLALVREEDRGWIAKRIATRRRGARDDYECQLAHKDGSWVSVIVEAIPLQRDDGEFDGTLALLTDITERKRTEEAIRETTERHRRLVEAIPGILYSYEEGTGGTYYSPQVESLLGYTAQQLRQHPTLGTIRSTRMTFRPSIASSR